MKYLDTTALLASVTCATVLPPPWTDPAHHGRNLSARGTLTRRDLVLTKCDSDPSNFIYFTAIWPNGSHTGSTANPTLPALYYIDTPWTITYPRTVRLALFNNATPTPDYPAAHCYSTTLPNTDIRLKAVYDPASLRLMSGHVEDACGFLQWNTYWRRSAYLGAFGWLVYGPAPNEEIAAWVETHLGRTYPGLEIALLLGFTMAMLVGLLLLLVVRGLVLAGRDVSGIFRRRRGRRMGVGGQADCGTEWHELPTYGEAVKDQIQ